MNTGKTINPKWWNDKHASAWDRIKEALHRDWEQTKADFSSKGQDLDQGVGDTVRQAAGKQAIPPEGYPNPGTFEDAEPALRFGYSAANQYETEHKDWDDSVESKLKSEWESIEGARNWQEFKAAVKRGWQRARNRS